MFPFVLRESTQRRVCRIAFLLLCVLPTGLLVVYALWLKTPQHRRAQAAAWSRRTGAAIDVGHLLYPRPGATRLHRVSLQHPHWRQPLARLREVEITRNGDDVTVRVAQPEIAAAQLDELWRQCQRQLLNEAFPPPGSLRLIAKDITLTGDNGDACTLALLEIVFRAAGEKRSIEARYKLAAEPQASPAEVLLVHSDGRFSQLRWRTHDAELSLSPWAAQLPWLKQLGDDCRFQGELHIERTTDGLRGELSGRFTHVDLDRLVSGNFPHKLSGEATVVIDSARLEGDRIVELHGSLTAGPGVIGRSLLEAATREWNLASADEEPGEASAALLRYEAIAFNFAVGQTGLSLDGACGDGGNGILTTADGGRWQTAAEAEHDPGSLIRVLSKRAGANVPATASTRRLIRWWPLAAEEAGQETNKPPRGHLRSGS